MTIEDNLRYQIQTEQGRTADALAAVARLTSAMSLMRVRLQAAEAISSQAAANCCECLAERQRMLGSDA